MSFWQLFVNFSKNNQQWLIAQYKSPVKKNHTKIFRFIQRWLRSFEHSQFNYLNLILSQDIGLAPEHSSHYTADDLFTPMKTHEHTKQVKWILPKMQTKCHDRPVWWWPIVTYARLNAIHSGIHNARDEGAEKNKPEQNVTKSSWKRNRRPRPFRKHGPSRATRVCIAARAHYEQREQRLLAKNGANKWYVMEVISKERWLKISIVS